MRVTIKDIARSSGYSKTTVSFAFNDPARISGKAREKILAIAAELGYVPDPVARSLSGRKLGTIGLLLPHPIQFALGNPYMVRLISGLGEVCNREGLSLTMLPPTRGCLLSSVRSAAVDGFTMVGLHPESDLVQVIRHRHIPLVTIDGAAGEGIPNVCVNDREAAQTAMAHLLDQGHRRLAIVSMADERDPDQEEYSGIGGERLEGYRRALVEGGVPFDTDVVARISVPCSFEGGRLAGQQVLALHPPVTGIVAMSDIIAIGIIHELRIAGRRIPWDVSIVGFDDIPESSRLSPALTTVWQPAEDKGLRAGEMLVRMIHRRTVEERVEYRCRLVQRESVAPARTA